LIVSTNPSIGLLSAVFEPIETASPAGCSHGCNSDRREELPCYDRRIVLMDSRASGGAQCMPHRGFFEEFHQNLSECHVVRIEEKRCHPSSTTSGTAGHAAAVPEVVDEG